MVSLAADGYLGPWPSPHGLTSRAPNCRQGAPLWDPERGGDTWDAWGHYHVMLGLLLWHADSGDAAALRYARRMADRLCEMYLGAASPRLVDTGWSKVNLAPAHSLALLHRVTGNARYRDALQRIWWSIIATDRHNNGGFISGEMAVGDPHDLGAIETCCTIAWIALSVEMLRLTGDALVADETCRRMNKRGC